MHALVLTHDLCCCSFSHLLSNKQSIKASETTVAQWSADKAGSQQMHNFVRDVYSNAKRRPKFSYVKVSL